MIFILVNAGITAISESEALFTARVPSLHDLAMANYTEAVLDVMTCEVGEYYLHLVAKRSGVYLNSLHCTE